MSTALDRFFPWSHVTSSRGLETLDFSFGMSFFPFSLRQRKDELEQRMSSLQESRRELMVQLEGLMKLLKVTNTVGSLFFSW